MRGALGGPRVLLRRLREVMAEPVSAQERLDKIVVLIAANMVAEVCSIYVLRADGVKVAVFRQINGTDAGWADAAVDANTATAIEDNILTRARELRIAAINSQ